MDLVGSAALFYAVVAAYLLARGVGVVSTAKIVAIGLGAGLVLACTLGLMFWLIVLQKPAQTIAVFAMAMLPFAAVQQARDKLLASITPLGIVLLNVAVDFVPRTGVLPLSLAGIVDWLPLPGGAAIPARIAIAYLPTWIALLALRRGPPGDPAVRLLLGAWVCWVGLAAIAGPAWQAVSSLAWDSPLAIAAGLAASYLAVHALMLALSFVMFFTGDDAAAESLAASVRIDGLRPLLALAIGIAFWASLWLLAHVAALRAHFGPLVLALAFGLAGVLPSRMPSPVPELPDEPSRAPRAPMPKLGFVAQSLVAGAVALVFAYAMWRVQEWRSAEWRSLADFTREDLAVEAILVGAALVALLALVGLGCKLYEGLAGGRAPRWKITAAALAVVVGVRVLATPLWPGWRAPVPDREGTFAGHLPPDAELFACYDNPGTEEMLYSRLAANGVAHQRVKRAEGWCIHVQARERVAMRTWLRTFESGGAPKAACIARLGNGVETPVLRCGGS